MITVGLAHDLFISSAAIVKDGQVIAAIAEERLNRQKQFKGFPVMALQMCMSLANVSLKDVDVCGVGWNPLRHLEFPNYRFSNSSRFRPEYLYSIPNMLLGHTKTPSAHYLEQFLGPATARVVYYDHHLAHAANAFYLSEWQEAAVFTADARGERDTTTWGVATRDTGIQQLGQVRLPHSLGLFYSAVTQFLGFRPDKDEWKVMALAAYGKPNNPYYDLLHQLISVEPKTVKFYIDQTCFSFALPEVQGGLFFNENFVERFGPPRSPDASFAQRHYDIAWALQRVFEETTAVLLTNLHHITGQSYLVAAGGCIMNSVFNGKVTRLTPFQKYFVSSCPDDSGISVGAALLAYHHLSDAPIFGNHPHNYWGPAYEENIPQILRQYKIKFQKVTDAPIAAAQLLADGKIIGWFQGHMEFGQRALGNRSILADPRNPETKQTVNAAVKFREHFRPFAPAILVEETSNYFHTDSDDLSPFMERVFSYKEDVIDEVPAVVHEDGTGRLQTVKREDNLHFWRLIKAFQQLTGVPIVLNTSFNTANEPIVCTPADAIRTFFSSGLDALIMGDYLVLKQTSCDD